MKSSVRPLFVRSAFILGAVILLVTLIVAIPVVAQLSWGDAKATLAAWATQMPLMQVATQAAQQGIIMPQPVQATAYAMLTLMPAADVFGTLVAPNFMPPVVNPPTSAPPAQPTSAPPVQPPPPGVPSPTNNVPVIPSATRAPVLPTATNVPPTPTIGIGQFSGQVTYPPELEKQAAGIQLAVTGPNGATINVPAGANGTFTFSNVTAGPYTVEASAQGYLSTRISFVLGAGESRVLTPAVLVPGDTNGDNRVDLSDAALVASNFNGPAIVTQVDLNEDGWIDIHDLTLVGVAFGLVGPLPW
ncbi:MAG: carboxypeptidase regulatory-like domain-containing protein [Anaerolineae bacterium]|nr:carboxypeptidase regulatory-like domain-containing protein [Anaerolineae bacterium]